MPTLVQTLLDDFNDGTFDTNRYYRNDSTQVTETGGRWRSATKTSAGYWGGNIIQSVDLAKGAFGAKLASSGDQSLSSLVTYAARVDIDSNNSAYWYLAGGYLAAYVKTGGSTFTSYGGTLTYSSSTHVYFAIDVSGGNLRFLWSTDGSSWTVHASLTNPFSSTLGSCVLQGGNGSAEATTTNIEWDDLSKWTTESSTDPLTIPGLYLKYEADDLTGLSDGDGVSAHVDGSGCGYPAEQPVSGHVPHYKTSVVNSLPVLRFNDSTAEALRNVAAPIGLPAMTIAAVLCPNAITSSDAAIINPSSSGLKIRLNTGKVELVKSGSAVIATGSTALSTTSFTLVVVIYTNASVAGTSDGTWAIYLNGTLDSSGTHSQVLNASTLNGFGADGIFGGHPFGGDIAALLLFNQALNSTRRGNLTTFYKNKYNLGSSGTAYTSTVSDTVGITDSASTASTFAPTVSDTVGLLDSTSGAAVYQGTVSDSVGLTDAVIAGLGFSSTVSDSVGLLDSSSTRAAYAPTLGDLVGLLDGTSPAATYAPTVTDPVGLLDSAAQAAAYSAGVSDSVGLLDAPTTSSGFSATVSDIVGALDSLASTATYQRGASDALGIIDSTGQAAAYGATVSDTIGMGDSTGPAANYGRVASDVLGMLDSAAQAAAYGQTVSDVIGTTDSQGQGASYAPTVSDLVGLLDTLSVASTTGGGNAYTATITDTIGLLDALVQASQINLSTTDVLGLLDTLGAAAAYWPSVNDTVGMLDAATTSVGYGRTATDPVGLADAASSAAGYGATVSDLVGITDSVTRTGGFGGQPPGLSILRTITDAIGLTDSTSTASAISRSLTDALGVQDVVGALAMRALGHPPAAGGAGVNRRSIYVRQPQTWALDQERYRHMQALYQIGEWVFIVLMWHELDFEAGLVQRCSRCFAGPDTGKVLRIAQVYDQPIQNECPVCFGTTFEGGYRARIVRPAIVNDLDETERPSAKGVVHPGSVTFETAYDFRCRQGDYVFRADGSRWRVQSADRLQVRVGYQHPSQQSESVAYKLPSALEDRTTVAYKIPPTDPSFVREVLTQPFHYPGDFSSYEIENGPLIPPSLVD